MKKLIILIIPSIIIMNSHAEEYYNKYSEYNDDIETIKIKGDLLKLYKSNCNTDYKFNQNLKMCIAILENLKNK
jgi:Zn/Cd-binding protein ZinT